MSGDQHFTTADGCRIAYRIDGPVDRPVLMLSNSIATNLHMWDRSVAALGRSFRLLRYDTRGHGGSDAPAGPYSMDRLGRDVGRAARLSRHRSGTFSRPFARWVHRAMARRLRAQPHRSPDPLEHGALSCRGAAFRRPDPRGAGCERYGRDRRRLHAQLVSRDDAGRAERDRRRIQQHGTHHLAARPCRGVSPHCAMSIFAASSR